MPDMINIKPVTSALLLICSGFFLLSLAFPINNYLAFSLNNFISFPLVIVLNAFLHNTWLHFIYNAATLFFFGNAFEIKKGSKQAVILFFSSVIAGNLALLLFLPGTKAVGISAYVYGLIGALMIIKPKLKILMPLGIVSIPMPVFIAGPAIFIGELILSLARVLIIAHEAHIAGFMAGVIIGLINRFLFEERSD